MPYFKPNLTINVFRIVFVALAELWRKIKARIKPKQIMNTPTIVYHLYKDYNNKGK